MTTPTISEAARRAAWKAYATAMNRMTDGLNYDADKPPHEESIAMKEALQAALDSAHPAPKEGEAKVITVTWKPDRGNYYVSIPDWDGATLCCWSITKPCNSACPRRSGN